MSNKISGMINRINFEAMPISEEKADELLTNAIYANTSLPRQVGLATMSVEGHNGF